jgi:acetyl esterase/lipase
MKLFLAASLAAVFAAASVALAADAKIAGAAGQVKTFIYKKTPQGELAIHVHFPKSWKAGSKQPAIVFFFGGGWRGGRVTQFQPQAEYLAKRGMVAARADYRVLSRHKTTADKCVEDCKSAVRWMRQHAKQLGVDPQRIVASGGSAGGHTAAATATAKGFEAEGEDHGISSKPNLLVLFNPALNTARFADRFGSAELAKKASPVHTVAKDTPPSIIFFGTNDALLKSAMEYTEAARKVGVKSAVWTAEGQRHGFFNRSPWRESTLALTDKFLTAHGYLSGPPQIKTPKNATMKLAVETK